MQSLVAWLGGTRIAAQLAAVIVGAAMTGIVAVMFSAANGAWQEAVRAEVTRSTVFQEEVRAVYSDEAPNAFRIALHDYQAEALQPLIATNRLAHTQHEVATHTAFALRAAENPQTLAGDPQYALRRRRTRRAPPSCQPGGPARTEH